MLSPLSASHRLAVASADAVAMPLPEDDNMTSAAVMASAVKACASGDAEWPRVEFLLLLLLAEKN
jgi:hypothetical protein